MTDVHEAYVERRRWRIWPIVLLVLVAMFGIAVLVAMIMNIHGSITWPAGEVKFGFWPSETTSVAATAPPPAQVATEIPLSPPPSPPPQVQPTEPAQTESSPAPTPPPAVPVEPNAPVE
jgi:hypothetical protein